MNSVWDDYKSNFGNDTSLLDQPKLNKYLGDLFSVGEFYYYVIDFSSFPDLRLSYIDKSALVYHGVNEEIFSLNHVLSAVHEDDMPFCFTCEQVIMDFFAGLEYGEILNYKTSYTLRIKDHTNRYRDIQHSGIPISIDSNGGMTHTLNVHTDVSHIKQHSADTMSLLGLNGSPSYIGIDPFNPSSNNRNPLSDREREVLDFLARSFSSNDIAIALRISKHTVNAHRRSMLRKLDVSNTIELIHKAKAQLFN